MNTLCEIKTQNKVLVTPEMAKDFLSRSKGNRSIKMRQVERFKADMLSGRWKDNGDRLRFLSDGTLCDGHHRLYAVVETGVSIFFDICVIPENAKSTIDKGTPRSVADNFVLDHNIPAEKASALSAACNFCIVHDNAVTKDWGRPFSNPRTGTVLSQQLVEKYFFDNRVGLEKAFDWVKDNIKKHSLLISKGQMVAFLFLASRLCGQKAYDYLSGVLTGYNVEPGTNEDHIRNLLLAVKMKQRKMATHEKLYTVCKGFRSSMAGRNIKHLQNARFRNSVDNIPRFDVKASDS